MTPCPSGQVLCDPVCTPPCPPNQTCFSIAPGFRDGYCTWTPPSGSTETECDSPEGDCCCKCEQPAGLESCREYVLVNLPPGVGPCDPAKNVCTENDSYTVHHATGCCTMTEPESGAAIEKNCELTGAFCLECNRLQKPRPVPVTQYLPPLDEYFAPCYMQLLEGGIVRPDFPIPFGKWDEVYFNFSNSGLHPCYTADPKSCAVGCYAYSVCNPNPETTPDGCLTIKRAFYCEALDLAPPSPCGIPNDSTWTCAPVNLPECNCPPFATRVLTYGRVACPENIDIFNSYCDNACVADLCYGITCPENYTCVYGVCIPTVCVGFECPPGQCCVNEGETPACIECP